VEVARIPSTLTHRDAEATKPQKLDSAISPASSLGWASCSTLAALRLGRACPPLPACSAAHLGELHRNQRLRDNSRLRGVYCPLTEATTIRLVPDLQAEQRQPGLVGRWELVIRCRSAYIVRGLAAYAMSTAHFSRHRINAKIRALWNAAWLAIRRIGKKPYVFTTGIFSRRRVPASTVCRSRRNLFPSRENTRSLFPRSPRLHVCRATTLYQFAPVFLNSAQGVAKSSCPSRPLSLTGLRRVMRRFSSDAQTPSGAGGKEPNT